VFVKELLVVSAERYFNPGTIYPGPGYWSRITIQLQDGFDFEKRGKELLARIESAVKLFSEEKDESDK
jgi:hypothetical protein